MWGDGNLRILHTSDWHLGRSLEQISRIDEQRAFVDDLCRIADDEKIDLVLIAGDIYDTYNPSAAAEELFYDAIDRLNNGGRRAIVVIAGNHDNPERLCAASPLASKRGIFLLGYPGSDAGNPDNTGKPETIRLADSGPGWMELCIPGSDHTALILTMPYPSESRLEELLTAEADEALLQNAYSDKIGSIFSALSEKFRDDTVNLIVAHLFLIGGMSSDSERTLQVGGAMTVSPGVIPAKTHYAALGHLHRPQEIKSAACPTYYAGSPLAYSFSESDYSKAVIIIDAVPGEKACVTPVYLDCGKPLKRWYAGEGIGQAIQWCEEGKDANAWIDLEIATDRPFTTEEQKALRHLHSGIINIRPRMKNDDVEVLDPMSREGRRIDELFSDYYQYRMGTEIPDELMNIFLEIVNDDIDGSDSLSSESIGCSDENDAGNTNDREGNDSAAWEVNPNETEAS
jgi:exonuclease SbcD